MHILLSEQQDAAFGLVFGENLEKLSNLMCRTSFVSASINRFNSEFES